MKQYQFASNSVISCYEGQMYCQKLKSDFSFQHTSVRRFIRKARVKLNFTKVPREDRYTEKPSENER